MIEVVKMKFGSHLYGLNTPNSDVDYITVFIPDVKDLIMCDVKHTIEKKHVRKK